MTRFIVRRLLILPIALLAINFVGFSYAILAQRVQQSQNPFGSNVGVAAPILPLYRAYLGNVLAGDWGQMPLVGSASEAVHAVIFEAAGASLAPLTIAFLLSLAAGLMLGLAAVRANPRGIRPWLPPLASVGLASPSFFVGAVGVVLVLALYLRSGENARLILPLNGYGLDLHLVLPVLALAIRPTMQIAQTTAGVLVDELGKQHVVTARSLGIPLRTIRRKHALRNVLPAVILVIAGRRDAQGTYWASAAGPAKPRSPGRSLQKAAGPAGRWWQPTARSTWSPKTGASMQLIPAEACSGSSNCPASPLARRR